MHTVFVVVTDGGHWGKGFTLKAAAQAALKVHCQKTEKVVAYCYTCSESLNPQVLFDEISVDNYGGIHYPPWAQSIRLFGPKDSKIRVGALL